MEFVSVEEKIPMSFEKAKEVYEILKKKADELVEKNGYAHVYVDTGISYGTTVVGMRVDYDKSSVGVANFTDWQVAYVFKFLVNPFTMSPIENILNIIMRKINLKTAKEKEYWIIATLTQIENYHGVRCGELKEVRDWLFENYGEDIRRTVLNVLTGKWMWEGDEYKLYDADGNIVDIRVPYPPIGEAVVPALYLSSGNEKKEKVVEEMKVDEQNVEAKPIYKSRTVIGNVVAAILIPIFVQQFGMSTEEAAAFASAVFALLNMFFRAITDKPVR